VRTRLPSGAGATSPAKLPTLLRRVTGALLGILRLIPGFSAYERRQYMALERMAQRPLERRQFTPFQLLVLHPHRVRESLRATSDFRVIDLNSIDDASLGFLSATGLAVTHLQANRFDESRHADDLERQLRRLDFQSESLRSGHLSIVCPYSGRIIKSDLALMACAGQPIYYQFASADKVFFLAVGREVAGYAKLYLYLPDAQAVVLLDAASWAWLGRGELDQIRAFVICHWREIRASSSAVTPRRTCGLVDHGHFAHHLWNVLTGLERLCQEGLLQQLDQLLVVREPLGPIDQLFPELDTSQINRLADAELPQRLLHDRLFAMRIGGNRINNNVAERVLAIARASAPSDMLRHLDQLRRSRWPVLWITVRTGNRTWVSQADGIPEIVKRVQAVYPRLAVIIDGYAIPLGQIGILPGQQRAIDAERGAVAGIMNRLGTSIPVHQMIGKGLYESMLYTQVADCYFAHHGTLQNKIAWLSRKPGVVHSNRETVAGIGGTRRHYPGYTARLGGVLPTYLPPEAVSDVAGADIPGNVPWHNPLESYEVDVDMAAEILLSLLASLKPDRAAADVADLDADVI
jgi:hypothetical protein